MDVADFHQSLQSAIYNRLTVVTANIATVPEGDRRHLSYITYIEFYWHNDLYWIDHPQEQRNPDEVPITGILFNKEITRHHFPMSDPNLIENILERVDEIMKLEWKWVSGEWVKQ